MFLIPLKRDGSYYKDSELDMSLNQNPLRDLFGHLMTHVVQKY